MVLPIQSWATSGYEGFNFAPALFYSKSESKDNVSGTKSEQNVLILSLRVGVTMSGGFYLGGLYEMETTDSGSTDLTDKNLGVSAGFTSDGSFIVFHYIFNSIDEISATSEYSGSGYGLDFGHQFKISNSFSIGPQFIYRAINYNKLKTSGSESSMDLDVTTILPMISLGFTF